jgi:N-acyl-D-aspartate/D-glutamate deacylase
VHHLSEAPAHLYGLRNRGLLEVGAAADIAIFNAETVGPGPLTIRADLPGGCERIYSEAIGMEHVLVNGVELVQAGSFTEARPGRVLRSNVDTETVLAVT